MMHSAVAGSVWAVLLATFQYAGPALFEPEPAPERLLALPKPLKTPQTTFGAEHLDDEL